MARNLFFVVLISCCMSLGGCFSLKSVSVDPRSSDPLYKQKSEFLNRYFFFVTEAESKEFIALATPESFDKFTEEFWKKRDINPLTPENEFKDIIDQRIRDIENEVLALDGVLFKAHGGLRGEVAHVYLFYGRPNCPDCIRKLSEGRYHTDLMVWYYFDARDKPVFRFLFYNNFGVTKLFRNYVPVLSEQALFNTTASPLKEISNRIVTDVQDLYYLWEELDQEDQDWAFRGALFEFSYYSDVHIDDYLDAPEPAALTAARSKPAIIGQPEDLSERKFLYSSSNSFIPAQLEISKDGEPHFILLIGYSDVDWEINGETAEAVLDLRMSFQNKSTRAIEEFAARLSIKLPREQVENKRNGAVVGGKLVPIIMKIHIDGIENFVRPAEYRPNLRELVGFLEPGQYIVNVDLRHKVTKKYAGGWREEFTIK